MLRSKFIYLCLEKFLSFFQMKVERALLQWSSGTFEDSKTKFSADNYASRAIVYGKIAKALKGSQWNKILESAIEHINIYANARSNGSQSDNRVYDLTGIDDEADASKMAELDEDSDLADD